MTKTVFSPGTLVSSQFLNAVNNPIFVDAPANDGEIARLTDADLSNTVGQLKSRFSSFEGVFKVSPGAGLVVNYAGGSAILPNGTLATISPGSLALTNNATNYVFVDRAGAIACSTGLPLFGFLLAQITTVSGAISGAIIDLRSINNRGIYLLPRRDILKLFGGNGDEGAYTLASGTATLAQGEYYFSSFTVGETATLTLSAGITRIYVSGNVVINGTINVNTALSGGASKRPFATGFVSGGDGSGVGKGGEGGSGNAYNYGLSLTGSSGGAPSSSLVTAVTAGTCVIAAGGAGGGGLVIEAAGAITLSATATINTRGEVGGVTTSSTGSGVSGGGGGGSGGVVILKSLISVFLATGSTVDLRGGGGGNAFNWGGASGGGFGGGGGGGGQLVLISPANTTTGANILLTGGAGGTSTGATVLGGGGGGCGGAGGGSNPVSAGSVGVLINRLFVPVG